MAPLLLVPHSVFFAVPVRAAVCVGGRFRGDSAHLPCPRSQTGTPGTPGRGETHDRVAEWRGGGGGRRGGGQSD